MGQLLMPHIGSGLFWKTGEGHWTLKGWGVWWFSRQPFLGNLETYTQNSEGLIMCKRGEV